MTVRVICHMISSVDGRLHPSRWSRPAKDIPITESYEAYASKFPAQAWMVGRTTLAEFEDEVEEKESSILPEGGCLTATAHNAARDGQVMAVVLDPKAKLHYKAAEIAGTQPIVTVVGKGVVEGYLSELREMGVSYIVPEDISDLKEILATLESVFGVQTLLLEGGGVINGSFLNADLIDELSVLIYPAIDGAYGAPAYIGYKTGTEDCEDWRALPQPAKNARLNLIESEVGDSGLVWLHYALK